MVFEKDSADAPSFQNNYVQLSNCCFMKMIKIAPLLAAVLAVMSFTGARPETTLSGTKIYGNCSCENASNSPKVELTLNQDQTFRYLNSSDPAKKVDVFGRWEMKGKKVVLRADGGGTDFHSNWKFDKNEPCVLSRKGLEFIRLCDVEACK